MNENEPELLGTQEAADHLGVTPRTLRFYEDRGLIHPKRVGSARAYTRREMARMRLILRGKRLGFSVREIQEFLDLYDADPRHAEQKRLLLERCRERIKKLKAQRDALAQTLAELEQMERSTLESLRGIESGGVQSAD